MARKKYGSKQNLVLWKSKTSSGSAKKKCKACKAQACLQAWAQPKGQNELYRNSFGGCDCFKVLAEVPNHQSFHFLYSGRGTDTALRELAAE